MKQIISSPEAGDFHSTTYKLNVLCNQGEHFTPISPTPAVPAMYPETKEFSFLNVN